jgi:hypothetical protein
MTRAKHRKAKPRGGWQFVYDGQRLVGVVEQQPSGEWASIVLGVVTGLHPSREAAIAALDRIAEGEGR